MLPLLSFSKISVYTLDDGTGGSMVLHSYRQSASWKCRGTLRVCWSAHDSTRLHMLMNRYTRADDAKGFKKYPFVSTTSHGLTDRPVPGFLLVAVVVTGVETYPSRSRICA